MKIDNKILESISKSADHNYCLNYGLKNDDIYVEAGAYIGRFITKYIRGQETGVTHNIEDLRKPIIKHLNKTILIEPCTSSSNILKLIQSNNLIENGIIIKKAIYSERKQLKFINWKENYEGSRIAYHDNDYPEQSEEIEADTIDNIVFDLNLPRIDLLCGDVEGQEVDMIKGAETSLEKGLIKHIAICTYHKEPDYHIEISRILRRHKFNVRYESGITFATKYEEGITISQLSL